MVVLTARLLPEHAYPASCHPGVASAACRSLANLPRYLSSPLHEPSIEAFGAASDWLASHDPKREMPVILDSGCGTGRSTRMLARAHPDCAVIGVDRSEIRLRRGGRARGEEEDQVPPNALLVRAELATFWRLMRSADVADERGGGAGPLAACRVRQHMLLYPNPYPKPTRLNKRWHAHPAFPLILAMGGGLEVRSNWRVYLEEFELAVRAVAEGCDASGGDGDGGGGGGADRGDARASVVVGAARRRLPTASWSEILPGPGGAGEPLTLFELKYSRQEGQRLHALRYGG